MKSKILAAGSAFMLLAVITGCSYKNGSIAVIDRSAAGASYTVSKVQIGDMTPSFNLRINQDGLSVIRYGVNNDNLEIEKLYVTRGDKVKEGDLIITFSSSDLSATIEKYEARIAENNLLKEHYTKLMSIDPDLDYSDDIEMLDQDSFISNLYLEEAQAKLDGYTVRATADGTITYINENILGGFFVSGNNLIYETCGTGKYTTSTSNDYEFRVGDIYTAYVDVVPFELKVDEVTYETLSSGVVEQTIIFDPISDMSSLSDNDSLVLSIVEDTIENAVYVDKSAVVKGDGEYFVYVLENGVFTARHVEIGDTVGSYTIILDGLTGNEEVAIR